ncbi:MAG TPA: hypothetical protein DEO65_03630 [Bacillus bacterium]|nr:hypothetical protein [Bacillus sp. (in: firmicutes)]
MSSEEAVNQGFEETLALTVRLSLNTATAFAVIATRVKQPVSELVSIDEIEAANFIRVGPTLN